MISVADTLFVVVDIQEKLVRAMYEKEALIENAVKLVQGAKILGIPIVYSEQNPRGLGPTIPELAELLAVVDPITKLSFSCWGEDAFVRGLRAFNRRTIVVAGIESHVCVYQTAADLLNNGYHVEMAADVVSSRTLENKNIGIKKCKILGAQITSVEMVLFELLQVAQGDKFKQMLKVVK